MVNRNWDGDQFLTCQCQSVQPTNRIIHGSYNKIKDYDNDKWIEEDVARSF